LYPTGANLPLAAHLDEGLFLLGKPAIGPAELRRPETCSIGRRANRRNDNLGG
jgi:hypothetical protein